MGEGDLKELRELVEFLKASGVAEFDMERPELKVRLTFAVATVAGAAGSAMAPLDYAQLARLMNAGAAPLVPTLAAVPPEVGAAPSTSAPGESVSAGAGAAAVDEDAGLYIVKSPLVGTFYEAASPGAEPFLKVGDKVATGKVMCIVEAMKIMNEIESDVSGEVVKVYAKAGQPVEYGQKLFGVRV